MTVSIVKEQETSKSHAKETVIVSLCALGAQCRYDGKSQKMGQFLYEETSTEQLMNKYIVLPLCGEIMGGLRTPREPCDVVETPEGLRVIGRNNSKDFTAAYNKGALEALRLAKIFKVKKAYLLKDSPMCEKGYGILTRMLEEKGIHVSYV